MGHRHALTHVEMLVGAPPLPPPLHTGSERVFGAVLSCARGELRAEAERGRSGRCSGD